MYAYANGCFYPLSMRSDYEMSDSWPTEYIEVTESVFTEFSATPPDGKIRGTGDDGMPAWVDIPPPTKEELIQTAENERERLLKHADDVMLDWRTELMLGEISDANRAKLSAWLAYKNDVKSVDVTTDPEHVNWPAPLEA